MAGLLPRQNRFAVVDVYLEQIDPVPVVYLVPQLRAWRALLRVQDDVQDPADDQKRLHHR
jgi:hypothetical protein